MLDKVTKLLLVEDDEDDYILTCDYLQQLDSHTFNVEWISSPEQAIEKLSKNEHDICLLDYRLGASNGLSVLKKAIANGFSGPIIMLTGQSNDELDSAALDAGAVDYLIKTEMSSSRFARAIRYALARKDVEGERVERLKAEAENRSKDRFLAHLSHELRTPLSSILGYTELLLQSDFSHQAENELGVIYRNGKHLLNLDSMLADVYTLMRVSVLDKGLTLRFESQEPLPLVAKLDATRVRQILINLINNAVKFTDKGEIVVKAWTQWVDDTEMLFFSIKDSGMGIAPEKQELIFKPFEQIADVESRSVGGAGLGLAICAELLNRMHGRIDLHSEIGKGSTFTISVYPGDISEVERQTLNFTSAPQLQSKSAPCKVQGRVLVVDDLRDLRMLVGHMISTCGARVDYAEHGQQALEKVRIAEAYKAPYDIIFIDIHMPIMGGKEATIELRKMGYKGPIIALTAATMKGIHEELAALGFNDVIPKPVDSSALYQCLQDYLIAPECAPQAKNIASDKVLTVKKQRFLLVEDDHDAAQITQLLLESLGVETVIASSCAQCLQILNHDQQFNKVLLDMHLPDGRGVDLGQQINDRYPELRLVIVSGAEPDPKQIKDLNIDRVLLKPINLSLLETLISS